MIASQFEEQWESQDCNKMCDHCRQPRERKEVNITAYCIGLYEILTKAATIEKRLTGQMVIDTWLDKGPVELRLTTVKKPPIQQAEAIIAILLVENYLKEDFQISPYRANTYIQKGARASTVLSGNHNITLILSGPRKPSSSSATGQKLDSRSSSGDKHNTGIKSETVHLKNKSLGLSVSSESNDQVHTLDLLHKHDQVVQKDRSKLPKAASKNSNLQVSVQREKCSSKLSLSKKVAIHQQTKDDNPTDRINSFAVIEPESNNCVVDLCSDDDSSNSGSFVDIKRKTDQADKVSRSYKRIKTFD